MGPDSPAPLESAMLLLFSSTLFLSAALMFAVQPMYGRMVLPLLGGSPSVWNTVMVFYQVTLLVGYGYAHALSRRGPRWGTVHLALLAIAFTVLPLRLRAEQTPPPGGDPVAWLLLTMASTVALPFLLLSTSGPLLQRWFAHTGHAHARDPYFLYAASNVGSMVGLLAYPFLLEPRWTLQEQSRGWTAGYIALLLMIGACALVARRGLASHAATAVAAVAPVPSSDRPVTARRRIHWMILAFAPSSLMLGVTTHLSTDLVAVPLLWVVPLAVYLLTFILAFAGRALIPTGLLSRLQVFAALGVLIVLVSHASEPLWFVAGIHLLALFALALSCHSVLARSRPGVSHLTEFYVWVAAGGALGGAFNALIAPVVFDSVIEYPLALMIACALAPVWPALRAARKGTDALPIETDDAPSSVASRGAMGRDLVVALTFTASTAAIVLLVRSFGHEWLRTEFVLLVALLTLPLFALRRRPIRFGLALGGVILMAPLASDSGRSTLHAERGFFGIHRVQALRTNEGRMHRLVHGTTLHGMQWVEPAQCDEPLSYYHRNGPAGQVFSTFGGASPLASIGVVGLGTGALSAYAEPGQRWTYFEIDPAVVRIATNADWFCYVDRSAAPPRILLGDARLTLAADTTRYDLLVLDAYSSDAVPVHLLTREAVDQYFARLRPEGVLVLHLSNRHFDLERVIARIAREEGLAHRMRIDGTPTAEQSARGIESSSWAVLARAESDLGALTADARWRRLRLAAVSPLWTDDYSSLVSVLR
jgi:SAM-dependent methyltransferase